MVLKKEAGWSEERGGQKPRWADSVVSQRMQKSLAAGKDNGGFSPGISSSKEHHSADAFGPARELRPGTCGVLSVCTSTVICI